MAMQTTAVRFAPEERAWIQSYADFMGESFSEVVRQGALELVEDAADLQEYNKALQEDDGERIPFDQVMKTLGSLDK